MALDTPAAVRHDDPINNARNKYQFVPVVPESLPNGHVLAHRQSNSLRELQPFTVILKTNAHTLPDRVSLLRALTYLQLSAVKRQRARATLEYHPVNTSTTGTQLSVLQSVTHYRPFGLCDLDTYYRLVLRGHPPEHRGSIFARSGPFNCLPDIVAYARLSKDWNRAFQVQVDIAWHAWCLANDRFIVYQPEDEKFSELMPPYCKVFFRTDFTSPKELPSPLAVPEADAAKIKDKTLDFWDVARRVDATIFVLYIHEYVVCHYPESKNQHSMFLNLCCRDWINGMRTLRHRQAPVMGIVQHVQDNLSSSVERVSGRRKKPSLPIRWGKRGSTKDPAIDQLDLKLARPDGNNESKAKRPDNVLEALSHTVPFVFHALGMEPFHAVLDTLGVRSPHRYDAGTEWITDMLQLMSIHGSRSGREVTRIERDVRRRHKKTRQEDEQKPQPAEVPQPPATETASNTFETTLRLEPRITESRLFYTFSMEGDGELHHRSPLPSIINTRDVLYSPRDVTTPSNLTMPAFLHLMHHGRDVLFSMSGILTESLRVGVSIITSLELPNPNFPLLVFAPTQTTPGIFGFHDGFVIYHEHNRLVRQAQPAVELSPKFRDFISKQQFMRYFTWLPPVRSNEFSREASALRMFKIMMALRCLIRSEADVLVTLASRFRSAFTDPRTNQFRNDRFFGFLQLGDYIYRANVTFNVRTAYSLLPALRSGIKENYTTKPLTAARSFKLPDYGLLETKHIEEWVSRHTGLKLVYAQGSFQMTRIIEQIRRLHPDTESDNHAQQILLADLCSFIVVNIRRCTGNEEATFDDRCGFLGTAEQREILGEPQVLASFHLPLFDRDCGQIVHPQRKLVYTQTLFTTATTVANWFYDHIIWPTLQFVALATVPVPVYYEYRPIHKPTKTNMVSWSQLSRLCRQAPLEKEIDRIARDIRGAATALTVKYKREPTSSSLLTLLRTQPGLVSRLPHHRLVTVTALIDSLCPSDRKVERDRDPTFQVEYNHFIQQAIAAGGGGGSSAVPPAPTDTKSSVAGATAADVSVSSFTKVQCNCAQEMLFSLQKPASPIAPDAVAAICQRLTHDEHNSRDLPHHPLDRVHAAFRFYYTQLPTAKQSTVLTNINQTIESSSASRTNGLGSRAALLDSLTVSSVKRLRDLIVMKPRPAPLPTAPAKSAIQKRLVKASVAVTPIARKPTAPKPNALAEPVRLSHAVAAVATATVPTGIVMATVVSEQPSHPQPIAETVTAVPEPPVPVPVPLPPPPPTPVELPKVVRVHIPIREPSPPPEVDYGEDDDDEPVPEPPTDVAVAAVVEEPVPATPEALSPPLVDVLPPVPSPLPASAVDTEQPAPSTPLTPIDPEFKEMPERPVRASRERSRSRSRSSVATTPTNGNTSGPKRKRSRSRSRSPPLPVRARTPSSSYSRPLNQIDRIRSSSPKRHRVESTPSPRYSHANGNGMTNGSSSRGRDLDRERPRRAEYTQKELHTYLDDRVRDSRNYDPSRREPLQFHGRIVNY